MPTLLSPNGDIVINDDGNMGFGTSDIEAWSSLFTAIQLSDRAAIAWKVAGDSMYLAVNAYATDEFEWRYRADGNAMLLTIDQDFVSLRRAVSGDADDVITWITSLFTASTTMQIGDAGSGLAGLSVQIGSIAEAFAVGGVWYSSALLSVGNVGTGEDTLFSHTLPADILTTTRIGLVFEAWGAIANNANAKTLRFRFGAAGVNLAFSRTMTPSVSRSWHLRVEVYRTGAATQIAFSTIQEGSAGDMQIVSTLDQTMASDVVTTLTAEAVSNNDVVLLMYKISWSPRAEG